MLHSISDEFIQILESWNMANLGLKKQGLLLCVEGRKVLRKGLESNLYRPVFWSSVQHWDFGVPTALTFCIHTRHIEIGPLGEIMF